METSLHRQLKEYYADENSQVEVKLGRYRIDLIRDGRLIEIQQSSLSSIRNKIRQLCEKHPVDVVKPIVARKRIVRLDAKKGKVVSERWSPRKNTLIDIFDELLHFTDAFPHQNLRLIVPIIEIVETRYPGHGKRRRWRANDFVVADRNLSEVLMQFELQTKEDLCQLMPADLPTRFDTEDLARSLGVPRSDGQRIAYVLRNVGAAKQVGKAGNRWVYQLVKRRRTTGSMTKNLSPMGSEPLNARESLPTTGSPRRKSA